MLLEIAVGDAYGAGFEYADPDFVHQRNDLSGYVQHPRHKLVPGVYTDDTQMSLAIAEMILSKAEWTRENLADAFVRVFKRDQREGYAQGFYNFLVSVVDGAEFLRRIKPDSDKSGAAMRAVPIGIYPAMDEVKARADLQARLTHNTTDGAAAAVAAALSGHYFLYKLGPKADLGRFLETHVAGSWSRGWSGKVGAQGTSAVRAAVAAIESSTSMSELLQHCIAYTGDVDTVAAIACGAAAACAELENDIPSALLDNLENKSYGREYLQSLDHQLETFRQQLATV